MTTKYNVLIFQCVLCSALVAGIPSENRVAEILKYCTLAEEGGFGYQREANLSTQDKESFQRWFMNQNDPLDFINKHVTDEKLRSRAVIVASATLDDEHFYRVSLNALQRFADGKASEMELERILIPDPDKRGLLAIHFRDERLQSVLKKCLDRGITDPDYVNLANHILSGEGAKSILREMGSGVPERYGPLAKKALSNTPGNSDSGQSNPDSTSQSIQQSKSAEQDTPGLTDFRSVWVWIGGGLIASVFLVWRILKRRG